jgi:signal transduction histidine kinase
MSALSTAAFEQPFVAPLLELPSLDHRASDELDRVKKALALQLHDGLAQSLYSTLMQIGVFAREQRNQPDVLAQLDVIQDSLRETLNDLRETLTELRGQPTLANDLLPAMRETLARFQQRTTIKVSLSISRAWPGRLPPETCIHILRIVQEASNNAHKHGGATKIRVALRVAPDGGLFVSVRDNGRGLPHQDLSRPLGLGIVGMRERASLMGGQLSIRSRGLCGTTVIVNLPKEALSWSRKTLPPAS